jgi:hypothetical protein
MFSILFPLNILLLLIFCYRIAISEEISLIPPFRFATIELTDHLPETAIDKPILFVDSSTGFVLMVFHFLLLTFTCERAVAHDTLDQVVDFLDCLAIFGLPIDVFGGRSHLGRDFNIE